MCCKLVGSKLGRSVVHKNIQHGINFKRLKFVRIDMMKIANIFELKCCFIWTMEHPLDETTLIIRLYCLNVL